MTEIEASKLVAMLIAAFPNAPVPPGTARTYESFLVELELERAVPAVRQAIRTSEFFPTVAKIMAAYEALGPRKPEVTYRMFKPASDAGTMPPSELKAAIDEFLKKATP